MTAFSFINWTTYSGNLNTCEKELKLEPKSKKAENVIAIASWTHCLCPQSKFNLLRVILIAQRYTEILRQ